MTPNLISVAIMATIKAGRRIMQIYKDPSAELSVEKKSDDTPVTIADRASHSIIEQLLKTTGIPVLSEEGKNVAFQKRKQWKTFWLVDPLDGTKEFIRRNPEFTVNIALISEGRPVAGVVYMPASGTLYAGVNGDGAWKMESKFSSDITLFELKEQGQKLPCMPLPDKFTVMESRSHRSEQGDDYLNKLRNAHKEINVISMGSSLKLCKVAEGSAHEYARFGPTMEWDTAAGHAVVNGAGKKILRMDSCNELKYNKNSLFNPDFIVKNGSS